MQTLMEDYETHKVKRREKTEDNSVSVIINRSHSPVTVGYPVQKHGITTAILEHVLLALVVVHLIRWLDFFSLPLNTII